MTINWLDPQQVERWRKAYPGDPDQPGLLEALAGFAVAVAAEEWTGPVQLVARILAAEVTDLGLWEIGTDPEKNP